jgi:toxin FitB
LLFETRYFIARFTAKDPAYLGNLKSLLDHSSVRIVSAVTIYEIYKISLVSEGKEVAELRTEIIEKDFEIIDVDSKIAKEGAQLSNKLRIPMADSLIMATARRHRLPCVTDDPHFTEVKRVWV